MKLNLFITFISLSITSQLFSQALEERERQIATQNHIRTKTQIDYKYLAGKPSKTGVITSKTYYSRSGEIMREDYIDSKGQVNNSEIYDYDQNNNRTRYQREGSGGTYKKVSGYDGRNKLVVEAGFNGSENFRNEFNYDNTGKLQEATYTINGNLQQKLVYEHSGSTTHVKTYMHGSILISNIKMVYDNKGNIIEETTYGIDDRELEKKVYKYNSSSQLIEETKTQKGKFYYRYIYNYDSRGNILSIYEETLAKNKYAKKIYSYDSAGNLTEYKWRRNPDEEFNVKTYSYDARGICLTEHTYYPSTKFELLSKYEYEFY